MNFFNKKIFTVLEKKNFWLLNIYVKEYNYVFFYQIEFLKLKTKNIFKIIRYIFILFHKSPMHYQQVFIFHQKVN
jgi:hypothetical protein